MSANENYRETHPAKVTLQKSKNIDAYNAKQDAYFSTPEGMEKKAALEANGYKIGRVSTDNLSQVDINTGGDETFEAGTQVLGQIVLQDADGKSFSVPKDMINIWAFTPAQLQSIPKDELQKVRTYLGYRERIRGNSDSADKSLLSRMNQDQQSSWNTGRNVADQYNNEHTSSSWVQDRDAILGTAGVAGSFASGYFGGPLGAYAGTQLINNNMSVGNQDAGLADANNLAGILGSIGGSIGSNTTTPSTSAAGGSDAALNSSFDTGMGLDPGTTAMSTSGGVSGFIPPASEGTGTFGGSGGGGVDSSLAGAAAGQAAGGFFDNGNWIPTVLGAGANLYGAQLQSDAANDAASLAAQATAQATAENARQFDIGQENLAPWLSAGKTALGESLKLQGLSGDPSSSLAALQSSPGYQFRLKTGRQGLDAGSASRGGMGSGKAATSASGWNQDFASNEYGNRLNQLAGLSDTGQTTGQNMANLGNQYAANQGNLWTGNANAQGAAGISGANTHASSLYGLANLGMNTWDKYNK